MIDQQVLRSETAVDSSQSSDDLWRKEVQSRVAGYRRRRGRPLGGAFSMRLTFPDDEAETALPASAALPAVTASQSSASPVAAESAASVLTASEESSPAFAAPCDPLSKSSGNSLAEEEPLPSAIAVLDAELRETPAESPESSGTTLELQETPTASGVEETEADSFVMAAPEEIAAPAVSSPIPRPQPRRKVIAFPRQATSAPPPQRLADPIVPETPRIVDVPEELEAFPTTPLLDGLRLPPPGPAAAPADHIELPFQAVSIARRLYAGLIDCALVAAGAGVLGAVGYKLLPQLTISKPVVLAAAAVLVTLWAVYQYIFTMYQGATPGMWILHLRFRTFKGEDLNWRRRRCRVLGLFFATASLMMGLFWGLVDVDGLCWHDRISRTFLTRRG
jgi:uncharacterized RDD family membrane protein YckC